MSGRTWKRIVVKAGSQVVLEEGRPALARLYGLMEGVAALCRTGAEVLLVSSGAVGLGGERLGLRPRSLSEKQACAAVGQGQLMGLYQEGFGRLGLTAAQVLLTEDDFADARRHQNLRHTLDTLLGLGVVPILNENDTVSTLELERPGTGGAIFGDNDRLSALVAADLAADLLVLLTDVDALYTRNPALHQDAEPIPVVAHGTVLEVDLAGRSLLGRGGMAGKVEAARLAADRGVEVRLAAGHTPRVLERLLAGESFGTRFEAAGEVRS